MQSDGTDADLGDGEHDVRGGDEWRQGTVDPVAHDLGEHHADGLTQHDSLRLNAANTCTPSKTPTNISQSGFICSSSSSSSSSHRRRRRSSSSIN